MTKLKWQNIFLRINIYKRKLKQIVPILITCATHAVQVHEQDRVFLAKFCSKFSVNGHWVCASPSVRHRPTPSSNYFKTDCKFPRKSHRKLNIYHSRVAIVSKTWCIDLNSIIVKKFVVNLLSSDMIKSMWSSKLPI